MRKPINTPIGIIVSTYNNIDDLNLVIEGYRNQTDKNFILYIADDGSTTKTAELIAKKNTYFPVEIKHIWHEDQGFRLSAIRNSAISESSTPYLIITDGDCIPLPKMVETHRHYAQPGSFVTGGRLLLSKELSLQLRRKPWHIHLENKAKLIMRAIDNQINRFLPLIIPTFCSQKTTRLRGIRGCHLAFWRSDLLHVDGFDEAFQGWGREDSDIACRLFHAGIKRRTLRGMPLLHLWHKEAPRSSLNNNDDLLSVCIQQKRIVASLGISKNSQHKHTQNTSEKLSIIQICRRFGPVGGMERYVYELSRELANMGHDVHILCETNLCPETLPNIHIHELGKVRPKPRWLAHIRFSKHVHQWLEKHRTTEMIIHSHERTADHQVTTFHGPPFAKVRDLPLWQRLSLRIKMNLWLEQRELCNAQVQMIVPNSKHIANDLQYYYPAVAKRIVAPVVPGVTAGNKRPQRNIEHDAGVIGFVGKEWKRKGLMMAISIMDELAKQRPNLHFMVAGPIPSNIQSLFQATAFNFTLMGEVNTNDFYPQLDVLLHPSSNEPYGMVITEALSAGVPVVISDVCGAANEITPELGNILPLTESVDSWCKAIDSWLNRTDYHIHYQRSWHDMAMAYVQLYQKVKLR